MSGRILQNKFSRVIFLMALLAGSFSSHAATLVVNNTADAGAGSLRNALTTCANGDVIQFNIAGVGPHLISLTTPLVFNKNNVNVDASTEPDYTCGNPSVIVDLGGAWPTTFTVQGTGNTIKGISFRSVFFTFDGGGSHQLLGCWFNLNNTGTAVAGNNMDADLMRFINNSTGNTIGGTACDTRNVFSVGGATDTWTGFVRLNTGSNNTTFRGNYFGTDKSGMTLLNQNADHIIYITGSTGVTIDQNVIVGGNPTGATGGAGVYTDGGAISNMVITNNKIGVRPDGTDGGVAWGNAFGGVVLASAASSNITFNGNIVCRNGLVVGPDIKKCGFYSSTPITTMQIKNNFVGVTPSFQLAGNYFTGIFINANSSAITVDNNVIGDNGSTLTDADESHGLSLEQPCTNVTITNNYIGRTPAGADIGNYCSGITISGGGNYTITGNLIGFNKGMRPTIPNACIVFTNTSDVLIQNNTLGGWTTGPAGQKNGGLNIDGGSGIFISGASSLRYRIGGMTAGQQNIIAYNRSNGVEVQNGDYVEMRWNSFYCNALKAIDLNYGTAAVGNSNFGNGTITITGPVPMLPTSINGNRPANSIVDVFGTASCASGAACIVQGEYRRASGTYTPATSGVAGTTWSYNNGSAMYDDISALATGAGTDCNTGYCRTSEFSPCVDNQLPVNIIEFTATLVGNDVILDWSTSEEENNKAFVIERSADGFEFEELGTVTGNGTTRNISAYTFVDRSPLSGVSYYRLRQVDIDGKATYTPLISINNQTVIGISLYPNPTNGKFELSFDANGSDSYRVTVFSFDGRVISDYEKSTEAKRVRENIDLSGNASGLYLVRLEVGNLQRTFKVEKVD